MSTQLYCELGVPTPQPLLVAVLTSGGPGAELLVTKLLTLCACAHECSLMAVP